MIPQYNWQASSDMKIYLQEVHFDEERQNQRREGQCIRNMVEARDQIIQELDEIADDLMDMEAQEPLTHQEQMEKSELLMKKHRLE